MSTTLPNSETPPQPEAGDQTPPQTLLTGATSEPASDPVETPPADPATETPPADESKPDDQPKPPEPSAPFELNVAELTLPEGLTLDEAQAKDLGGLVNKLAEITDPKARAQLLVDEYSKAVGANIAAVQKSFETKSAEWATQVQKDPEIGGDKLPENMALVKRVLDTFGVEGWQQAFDETRAGNHPAIVKTVLAMAKALDEGKHIGGQPPRPRPTLAQAMYPNLPEG